MARTKHRHDTWHRGLVPPDQLDWATTAEIADVAATEAAGTSGKVARGDHVHAVAALAIEAKHLKVGGIETGNLLINGSFERAQAFDTETTTTDFIHGWASVNSGQLMAATSSYARTGTHVLRVRAGGGTIPAAYQVVPILPGRRYRLSAWVARNTSDGGAISAEHAVLVAHTLNASGAYVQFNVIYVDCGNSSTIAQYAGEYTTPTDGSVTSLWIELRIDGTPATNQVVIGEDIILAVILDPPGKIAVRLTADQTIANVTPTTVVFQTIDQEDDPGDDVSYNTSTGVFTINRTGWYQVAASVMWQSNNSGLRYVAVRFSDDTQPFANRRPASDDSETSLSALLYLTAGTTFSIVAYQSSGGNLSLLSSSGRTRCAIARLP
jgi:hypothetical protein